MATINISINDSGPQQGSPKLFREVSAEVVAAESGGEAPFSGENSTTESSMATAQALPGNGVVNIGSPPSWLQDAIEADKASTASDNGVPVNNSDGGAGPTD